MRLITVSKMREIEESANSIGVGYEKMMENAGTGLAEYIQDRFQKVPNKRIVGLVGTGNNGGDALVSLANLQQNGWQTAAILYKERKNDPLVSRLMNAGGTLLIYNGESLDQETKKRIQEAGFLLDGLIGTGIRLPLREEMQKFLTGVNDLLEEQMVIAVDCPSGVDCEEGGVDPNTLPADLTVCMEAVKTGMVMLPAFSYCGELTSVPIGLPKKLATGANEDFVIDETWVKAQLPGRSVDGHKKTFGTVTVVGGCTNFVGAPVLSGMAAYRSGSGLVTLAVPQIVQLALAATLPECTWFILDDENGVISEAAAVLMNEQMNTSNCLVVGPGIGREETTRRFLTRWLINRVINSNEKTLGFLPKKAEAKSEKSSVPPLVVDADALRWLAEEENLQQTRYLNMVLTPHAGEMSALTGLKIDEIQQNREKIAREFALKWQQVVVLKGALTIVADKSGRIAIVPAANSALAKAGSGDALSGIIAALIGEGMPLFEAACAGAWIHAHAGMQVAKKQGTEASLLVRDLIDEIPAVLAKIQQKSRLR